MVDKKTFNTLKYVQETLGFWLGKPIRKVDNKTLTTIAKIADEVYVKKIREIIDNAYDFEFQTFDFDRIAEDVISSIPPSKEG